MKRLKSYLRKSRKSSIKRVRKIKKSKSTKRSIKRVRKIKKSKNLRSRKKRRNNDYGRVDEFIKAARKANEDLADVEKSWGFKDESVLNSLPVVEALNYAFSRTEENWDKFKTFDDLMAFFKSCYESALFKSSYESKAPPGREKIPEEIKNMLRDDYYKTSGVKVDFKPKPLSKL